MDQRLKIQKTLEDILGKPENVHFQPPQNIHLQYPAIIYSLSEIDTKFADNEPYTLTKQYVVTAITRDPDSDLPIKLASQRRTRFGRSYVVDNLYHHIFYMYF